MGSTSTATVRDSLELTDRRHQLLLCRDAEDDGAEGKGLEVGKLLKNHVDGAKGEVGVGLVGDVRNARIIVVAAVEVHMEDDSGETATAQEHLGELHQALEPSRSPYGLALGWLAQTTLNESERGQVGRGGEQGNVVQQLVGEVVEGFGFRRVE